LEIAVERLFIRINRRTSKGNQRGRC
jgi:hypothetical protein